MFCILRGFIFVGKTKYSMAQLLNLNTHLGNKFYTVAKYDLFKNNCNVYTTDIVRVGF